jgi:hypothetical protein
MGRVKVPYYVIRVRGNGERHGYWSPTKAMIAAGARLVSCGPDGPQAWAKAAQAYAEWKAAKKKQPEEPRGPKFKEGTVAAAFAEFRTTKAWLEDKKPRTKEDWWRGWRYIGPAFGNVRPSMVTMKQLDDFRSKIETVKGKREAHRAIKIWRALWTVMEGLKYCSGKDPSRGFQNHAAPGRKVFWEFGDVRSLCRRAWEEGYYGLAAVIAVAWDTSFSPVDVRTLTPAQRHGDAFHIARGKTDKPAVGTLTGRSRRVVQGYLKRLGVEIAPNAPIFRNRSGDPYSKDTLGDDFRDIRALVFGPDEGRTLLDMRRSGAIEAQRGGATREQIGKKLANSFATNNEINSIYAPAEEKIVRQVDEARRRARTKK